MCLHFITNRVIGMGLFRNRRAVQRQRAHFHKKSGSNSTVHCEAEYKYKSRICEQQSTRRVCIFNIDFRETRCDNSYTSRQYCSSHIITYVLSGTSRNDPAAPPHIVKLWEEASKKGAPNKHARIQGIMTAWRKDRTWKAPMFQDQASHKHSVFAFVSS